MAEADNIGDGSSANLTAEEWERVCKVRTIRELHPVHARGREAAILLEHKGWDVMATTSFIKESDPDKLRAMIDKKGSGNRLKSKKEKQEPESSGTSPKNKTGKEPRQFACPKEKNVWWKSVPVRNPMSTCLKCGQEYEPIPKLEEWGIGEFKCICDHEFRGEDFSGLDDHNFKWLIEPNSKGLQHPDFKRLQHLNAKILKHQDFNGLTQPKLKGLESPDFNGLTQPKLKGLESPDFNGLEHPATVLDIIVIRVDPRLHFRSPS